MRKKTKKTITVITQLQPRQKSFIRISPLDFLSVICEIKQLKSELEEQKETIKDLKQKVEMEDKKIQQLKD